MNNTHKSRFGDLKKENTMNWQQILLLAAVGGGGFLAGWLVKDALTAQGYWTGGQWGPYSSDRGTPRIKLGGGLNWSGVPETLYTLEGGMDYGNNSYPLAVPQYPQPTPYDFNIPMSY